MSRDLLEPEGLAAPAHPADLAALEAHAGSLPSGFRAFLQRSDGYDGRVRQGHASFWPVRTILANMDAYEGAADVPGLLLVGSNGGPPAYGVLRGPDGARFVFVPFSPIVPEEVRPLGATFAEFLDALAAGEGW